MARQEIILGASPAGFGGDPPRTASSKINAMTTELYQGDALAKASGWGGAQPVFLPEGTDANSVTGNRLVVFNSGVNLPMGNAPYWFMEVMTSGDWQAQRAVGLTQSLSFTRFRHATLGWTAWVPVLTGGGSLADQLRTRNAIGIGTPYTYVTNIDAMTPEQGLVLGLGYVNTSTTGSKPFSSTFGVVNTVINGGDHAQQDYTSLTGQPGVTQNAYRRTGYGTSWGPWRLVMDSVNSQTDPQTAGGIISSAAVGAWWVTKYMGGMMCVVGPGPVVAVPANSWVITTMSVPAMISPQYMTADINVTPYLSHDHYGISSCSATTDSIVFGIRNGSVAQQFNTSVTVWGRWG
ncbi:hypothetical protein HZF02_24845 [Pseudomonas yamanorum]|nr:hypothetical protein HZF02_24845 [Pseudomonas yamanorum]